MLLGIRVVHYIPVHHDMMRQTNDLWSVRVMQHKVMYFLYLQVDPSLGPAAIGLGQPGALPPGLVQPCPKPRALIHKPFGPLTSVFHVVLDYTLGPWESINCHYGHAGGKL